MSSYFLRMGGMGAGAFFSPNDLTLTFPSFAASFFTLAATVSTLLNLVFSRALPRVALTAL